MLNNPRNLLFIPSILLILLLRRPIFASINENNVDVGAAARDSLYDAKDAIIETYGKNEFDRAVYRQPRAFFVQFYSSWCGHCRHFAPIFRQFVKRIAPWSKFVSPVAVNCGADQNFEFCRQHNITAFPTLKYFKFWSVNESDGRQFSDERDDVQHLTSGLAKFMLSDAQNFTPSGWPESRPQNLNNDVNSLWNENIDFLIFLIVPSSIDESILSIAYQTLLDFENYQSSRKIDIRLIDSSQNFVGQYLKDNIDFPGLIIFKKEDKSKPIFVPKSKLTADEILHEIADQTNINFDSKIETIQTTTPIIENVNLTGRLFVHKIDLLSALWHILYRDAAKFPVLDRAKLEAMKEFLEVVLKYFPSNEKEKQFLFNLLAWLNGFSSPELNSTVWISKLDAFQQQTDHPLPGKENFVACRGSTSKFRGFTCAVWILFHTITVNAYKIEGDSPNFSPRKIILSFKRYVTDIFGCVECGKHFRGETADLAQEVREPRDVVLYLWKVHNNVNRRLKGQKSEDPLFPKQQFPPVELCPRCLDEKSGQMDENLVLKFLLNYYSKIENDLEIVVEDTRYDAGAVNPKFRKGQASAPQSRNGFSAPGEFFNSFDVGLCLAFWLASIFLVFWLIFYFKSRRNRQKCLKSYFKMNVL